MTTPEEQDYLLRYARDQYRGEGEVVDLGCWLGSTTISLARGMAANPSAAGRRVFAYDRFIWSTHWSGASGVAASFDGRYREGDSFLDEFQRRIAGHEKRIEARVCDLTTATWDGGPIEFLEVDAMKSWQLCHSIAVGFFPHLIPQRSLVMHQDFKWRACPWIHLLMYRLRDHFSVAADLLRSTTTVFILERAVTRDQADAVRSISDFTPAEVIASYAYWRSKTRGWFVREYDLAEADALCQAGALEEARLRLCEVKLAVRDVPLQVQLRISAALPALKPLFAAAGDELLNEAVALRFAAQEMRPVWIWGAGGAGRSLLARSSHLRSLVRGFVDSDRGKWGTRIDGLPVESPAVLGASPGPRPFVIVSSVYADEIGRSLERLGFRRSFDFIESQSSETR